MIIFKSHVWKDIPDVTTPINKKWFFNLSNRFTKDQDFILIYSVQSHWTFVDGKYFMKNFFFSSQINGFISETDCSCRVPFFKAQFLIKILGICFWYFSRFHVIPKWGRSQIILRAYDQMIRVSL